VIAGRLAGQLIRVASRRLPDPDRALRRREWAAEAAAILGDRRTGRVRRQVRAVLFAADLIRSSRRMARRAFFPVAGWPLELAWLFPLGALSAADLGTHWLPLAHPVRLALADLLMAAVMAVQIVRERRHWLTVSKEELDSARTRRRLIMLMWWTVWWGQWLRAFNKWYLLAYLAGSVLVVVPILLLLERWIFTRPDLPGDSGERVSTSPGAAPADQICAYLLGRYRRIRGRP
jgi:hypothetical protein